MPLQAPYLILHADTRRHVRHAAGSFALLNVAFGMREMLSQHHGVHGGNIDDRAVKVG